MQKEGDWKGRKRRMRKNEWMKKRVELKMEENGEEN